MRGGGQKQGVYPGHPLGRHWVLPHLTLMAGRQTWHPWPEQVLAGEAQTLREAGLGHCTAPGPRTGEVAAGSGGGGLGWLMEEGDLSIGCGWEASRSVWTTAPPANFLGAFPQEGDKPENTGVPAPGWVGYYVSS